MKTKFFYMIFFLILSMSIWVNIQAQSENPAENRYRTWLDIVKTDSNLTIVGKFSNQSEDTMDISYKLVTERTGRTGRSNTQQAGSSKVPGRREVDLSRTRINVSREDFYKIKLQIFDNHSILAQDSVVYSGKNSNPQ